MADRKMIAPAPADSLQANEQRESRHPVMGLIGAIWANFGAGKTATQKRLMVAAWEAALEDIPVAIQLDSILRKSKEGQLWPPRSPAEIRKWCDEIHRPMTSLDELWYRTCLEEGLLDPDLCRRQLEKYQEAKAAGKSCYID